MTDDRSPADRERDRKLTELEAGVAELKAMMAGLEARTIGQIRVGSPSVADLPVGLQGQVLHADGHWIDPAPVDASGESVTQASPAFDMRDDILSLIKAQLGGYEPTLKKMRKSNDVEGIKTVEGCKEHWQRMLVFAEEKLK